MTKMRPLTAAMIGFGVFWFVMSIPSLVWIAMGKAPLPPTKEQCNDVFKWQREHPGFDIGPTPCKHD